MVESWNGGNSVIFSAWAKRMTDVDHRGFTPLFWTHVAPYGEVRLNMRRRLSLAST